MSVLRYRTVWGVDPGDNYQDWDEWFPSLKAQGYSMTHDSCLAKIILTMNSRRRD